MDVGELGRVACRTAEKLGQAAAAVEAHDDRHPAFPRAPVDRQRRAQGARLVVETHIDGRGAAGVVILEELAALEGGRAHVQRDRHEIARLGEPRLTGDEHPAPLVGRLVDETELHRRRPVATAPVPLPGDARRDVLAETPEADDDDVRRLVRRR